MDFATGSFSLRCPTDRTVALPCRVPGCSQPEVLDAHWDPILWRLCKGCQGRAASLLKLAPGLTFNDLTRDLIQRGA